MYKIVLDAGHGKNTAGKRCLKALDKNETREWVLNSRICDLVEKKLKAYSGYELLRVDDTTGKIDVALKDRVKKANNFNADVYISFHHNAHPEDKIGANGGSGSGIIAIRYTNASEMTKRYQEKLYNALIKETGLKGNRSEPMPSQNLYVLHHTVMPAVLLELGFMDSAKDVPIILTDEYADKCAKAVVSVLVEMGGLIKKKGFTDIKGHWAEAEINDLIEMGIVKGRTEDSIMPDASITRAEAFVLARRIIKHITGK